MVGVGRAGTRPRLRRHCPVLAALRSGLKRCAALPCRFAAAAQSRLRACGRFAGGRPLRRGAAAPAGSPAALRLLAAPAARLLRFAPAAVAARSAARPALASRPLRGSPLCPCACWAALSLSPVAPVLRLRASPPGVGLFCGWRGGAPAGAGLGVPLAAASGDAPPAGGGRARSHTKTSPLTNFIFVFRRGYANRRYTAYAVDFLRIITRILRISVSYHKKLVMFASYG